ncbi:hypothetical protein ABZ894_14895 [Nocardia beijingensis]|uniref:hypothetical protein n=1 Tax=Nocardia beijingensis TaxID=95162 RepID=UPI003407B693
MTEQTKPTASRVNPIVQAAADQVTDGKRRPRRDIHAPCSGQLSLFDPSTGKADQ